MHHARFLLWECSLFVLFVNKLLRGTVLGASDCFAACWAGLMQHREHSLISSALVPDHRWDDGLAAAFLRYTRRMIWTVSFAVSWLPG